MKRLILIVMFSVLALGAYDSGYKIIGGEPTDISKHPWQVSIRGPKENHLCGGFLISPVWVVTAAHCANKGDVYNYSIRAGSSNNTIGGQISAILKAIIYPTYPDTFSDIALFLLATPIDTPNAGPATLPEAGETVTKDQMITISGWGTTKVGRPGSSQLLQVQLPIVDDDICNRTYYGITETAFCAGFYGVGGKDACRGDSGGGAELDGKVVGIVSGGDGCAEPDFPGVYTKVSVFREWIRNNTKV